MFKQRTSKVKSLLWRFLIASTLVLGSMIVALGLGEIMVRLWCPQNLYGGGVEYLDPQLQPSDLKANFSGTFSHPDYRYVVNTDEHRLRRTCNANPPYALTGLVLGDSFAFGMGVNDNETFASILTQRLRAWGVNTLVLNGGVPAYDLSLEFCKYQKLRNLADFRLIIVAACFNDTVANRVDCHGGVFQSDKKVPWWSFSNLYREWLYPEIRDTLLGHSQLAVFLAYRLNGLLVKTGLRGAFAGVECFYNPEFFVAERDRIQRAAHVLKVFSDLIHKDNRIGVFIYIPGILELNNQLWATVSANKNNQPQALNRDLPRTFLVAAAKQAGFDMVIDPLEEADGHDRLSQGYFPLDMHLNLRGNEYIGQLLARKILAGCRNGAIVRRRGCQDTVCQDAKRFLR
jgi:hypothetical protein